jgi:hypothetical protein
MTVFFSGHFEDANGLVKSWHGYGAEFISPSL